MTPTIYTVATAHLDTSWHWPLERTIGEYLPKTLLENFALFEKYPDYTFSFEGAYRYELIEEYYPELFDQLKTYINQGRWRVAGSAWENGDVNIPSPEALLRNFLLGNGYFREKFGKTSCDVYLPDCFGFGRALPGVAAHAGLKGFATQKLMWGSAGKIPFALGRWQAPDGGEIFACPDAHDYTASLSRVRKNYYVKRALAAQKRRGLPPMALILHGVGDMGGAPKESSVQTVCQEISRETSPRVRSASSDDIFRDIDALPAAARNAFPVYKGEWLLSDHGTGCYTARTWSKRWNRQAEQLAFAAEAACAFAGFLGRMDYPRGALNAAWKRVIAHHFHDDMTGTSEEISYRRNWDDLMAAQQKFAGIYTDGVSAVINSMNTAFAAGRCAAVCNPTQWERRESVPLRLPLPLKGSAVRVFDAAGHALPSQLNPDGKTVVFAASLPPMSVTLFDVQVSAPVEKNTGLRVTETALENQYLSVKIDKNGDISSLYDKRLRRECLRAPVRLGIFDFDGSPTWPAWELYYPELKGKPDEYPKNPAIKIIETGPARVSLEITRAARQSTFRQVLSLDAQGQWLRVHNEVDWHAPRSLLKVEIPCAAANPQAAYDIGFGVTRRGNSTPRQYEVPAQQWADITDKSGAFGLTVLSDCKAGWDKPDNHTLRLTAVFSPRKGDRGTAHVLDFGRSRFDFGLYPHGRAWQAGAVRAGACFGQSPAAFWPQAGDPAGETCLRFGQVKGNMVVRALKEAESGGAWVLRVQETEGKPLPQGQVILGGGITDCVEIDGAEQERVPPNCAVVSGGALKLSLSPYEMRSFKLQIKSMAEKPKAEKPKAEKPLEITNIALPLTWDALPDGLRLPFDTPALRCEGQAISLPPGRELRLQIASFDGDRPAVFLLNSEPYTRRVYDAREPVGAGDLYALGSGGYVKPATPAREFSHLLDAQGKPIIGMQTRFYAVSLPLPGGAAKLVLPRDPAVVVLEAQVRGEPTALPAQDLYDRVKKRKIAPAPPAARVKMPLRSARVKLRTVWNFARVRAGIDWGR